MKDKMNKRKGFTRIRQLITGLLTIKKSGHLSGHTGPHGANPDKR